MEAELRRKEPRNQPEPWAKGNSSLTHSPSSSPSLPTSSPSSAHGWPKPRSVATKPSPSAS